MMKNLQSKPIETPYKDIHGETIKVGDIIVFGLLGQHWLIKQKKRATKYVKKGAFIMEICSDDSGKGWWEELTSDVEIPENQTLICKERHFAK